MTLITLANQSKTRLFYNSSRNERTCQLGTAIADCRQWNNTTETRIRC